MQQICIGVLIHAIPFASDVYVLFCEERTSKRVPGRHSSTFFVWSWVHGRIRHILDAKNQTCDRVRVP